MEHKKDEELFVINKKPTNLAQLHEDNEEGGDSVLKKKGKKSLDEKLNNLGCYRNLRPDPISAPAHIVAHRKDPQPDSKRQAKLSEKKAKAVKKLKTENNGKASETKKSKSKNGEKFDVFYETNPVSDIWKCKSF